VATLAHEPDTRRTHRGPTLDDIRGALDERGLLPAKAWTRQQFDAHCPCHDDRRPSLSIGETSDGRDLIRCHAACSREEILQALGLWDSPPRLRLLQGMGHRDVRTLKAYAEPTSTSLWPIEERWRRRAAVLGVTVEPGESFGCVVPRHGDHASKIERVDGKWRIHCASDPTHRGLSLAEAFAAQRMGDVWLFGDSPLASRWFDLLSYRAGVLEPTPVELAVPARCGATVARVAACIGLFLGLRDAGGGYGPGEPFTFAREFAVGYCGVSTKQARGAMAALERHGVIERSGDTVEVWPFNYRAILWVKP
jgi:hypothetical protein